MNATDMFTIEALKSSPIARACTLHKGGLPVHSLLLRRWFGHYIDLTQNDLRPFK